MVSSIPILPPLPPSTAPADVKTSAGQPFYLNPIWWSARIVQAIALAVAFGYVHITNDQEQLLIGFITTASTEAGLQLHSAIVYNKQ